MHFDTALIINAISSGLLLGCFYAIAAAGLAISFGMLDVVNIAHPSVMVLGSFLIAELWARTGIDPLVAAAAFAPIFGLAGAVLYRGYYAIFEQRGAEAMRGLAFFFGLLSIVEVALLMVYGANQMWTDVAYANTSFEVGILIVPLRMFIPALYSLIVLSALILFLKSTLIGRAIAAVSQDREALRFVGVNPLRIKMTAFGISIGFAALAGGCLIVEQPVDAQSGQVFIGKLFAIVIMAGLGSLSGAVMSALAFGVLENLTATILGPSWTPAIAFGLLLLFLTVRPEGLFGRAHA